VSEVKPKETPTNISEKDRVLVLLLEGREYQLSGIWHWDLPADLLFCSDALISLPPDSDYIRCLLHPDDVQRLRDELQRDFLEHLQFRVLTNSGSVIEIEGYGISPQGGDLFASLQEGARQQAYEARAAQRQLAFLEQRAAAADLAEKDISSGTWWFNAVTGDMHYSDGIYRIHGLPVQSLNAHPQTFSSFIHADDVTVVTDTLLQVLRMHVPLELHYRIYTPNGKLRFLRLQVRWAFNELGQEMAYGSLQDRTDARNAEEAVSAIASHARQRSTVLRLAESGGRAGFLVYHAGTRKLEVSEGAARQHGLKAGVLATFGGLLTAVHAEDRPAVQSAFNTIDAGVAPADTEYRTVRPDGKVRHLRLRGRILEEEGHPLVVCLLEDLTLERSQQRRLSQLSREEGVRQAQLQSVEEGAGLGSWTIDLLNGAATASEGLYRLLGSRPTGGFEVRLVEKNLHPDDRPLFREGLECAIGATFNADLRLQRNGSLVPVRLQIQVRKLEERPHLFGTLLDQSAVTALNGQLQERVGLLQVLSNNIPDGIVITDIHHNIIFWNRRSEELFRVKTEGALQRHFFDVLPDLQGPEVVEHLDKALRGDRVELSAVPQGRDRFLKFLSVPLFNDEGSVTGILHIVHDTSQSRDLNNRLTERINFIESLIESSVDRIIVMDRHMNYRYCNKRAAAFYGLDPADLIGKNVLEVFPQSLNAPAFEHFRQALRGETVHLPASENLDDEIHLTPIREDNGNVNAVLWVYRERADEVALQRRLEQSEALLRDAEISAQAGSYELDIETNALRFTDGMYLLFGVAPKSIAPSLEWIDERSHPGDLEPVHQILEAAVRDKQAYSYRRRIFRPDGTMRLLEAKGHVVCDNTGKACRLIGMVHDITERAADEQALRESRHFIGKVTEATPDFIMVYDLDEQKVVYVNRQPYRDNEERYKETIGIGLENLMTRAHPDDRILVRDFLEGFRTATDDELRTLQYRVLRDGGEHWYCATARVFSRNEAGAVTQIIEVIHDIDSEVELRQELTNRNRQLEKQNQYLEARHEEINLFSIMATHDLKEPLRKIHLFSSKLLQNVEDLSPQAVEHLERIARAARRMDALLRDLTLLTRIANEGTELKPVALDRVVDKVLKNLVSPAGTPKLRVERASLPVVQGNELQLYHLFYQLLENALRYRHPDRDPEVHIDAVRETGDEKECWRITVRDNGIGFAPEYAQKIFGIFQRLQPTDDEDSTGIGLTICRKVMENHGGRIEASGTEGSGAEFSCYFSIS
jgi:PAS domain S-box-containing protein